MTEKQNKKILIVEDEKPMARALELKLRHSGFATTVVYDGERAIAVLGKDKFDLILLDLVIPKLDGFHVLEKLREQNEMPPVIVISNLGQNEDAQRARNLGARGYFIKSETPIATIIEHVKKLLKT